MEFWFLPTLPNSKGCQEIQLLIQFPFPISHGYYRGYTGDDSIISRLSTFRRWRCYSGGRSGGSRCDWDKNRNPNRGSRFSDAYGADEYDEVDEFGFRNAAKQRRWWSNDLYSEDEEGEGFGILEPSIRFKWVSKAFRAFGWMIPVVMISLLMGTGPDAIIMALALPLAQSALSLAADTLWGTADETPRMKPKSKKRPFARAPGRVRARKEKEIYSQARKQAGNYKSWFEANNVERMKRNQQNFGGWDELDNLVRVDEEPRTTPVKEGTEPREQERVKISRRPKGDTPLFMRLLLALFPYLGFWTKLF